MRSPSPIRPPDRRRAGVAAGVGTSLALLLAACAGPAATVVGPDRVLTGPQGAVGQFAVECAFDRFAPDDPIVHPGHAGAAHLHQFFGAVGVTATSDHDELVEGDTTCDQRADTASYWTPALLDGDGAPIEPIRSVAYYRAGPDVDPARVEPYPPGLMMIAGDPHADDAQPLEVVAWSCGSGGLRAQHPPSCPADGLRLLVTFPDCWNGVDVRSPVVAEPDRHVAYSTGGTCPPSHPTHIPQLQFAVDWPQLSDDRLDELRLASGSLDTAHADFWNAWDQAKLTREVVACLHRGLACVVSS